MIRLPTAAVALHVRVYTVAQVSLLHRFILTLDDGYMYLFGRFRYPYDLVAIEIVLLHLAIPDGDFTFQCYAGRKMCPPSN
jgi:hypothetical protein